MSTAVSVPTPLRQRRWRFIVLTLGLVLGLPLGWYVWRQADARAHVVLARQAAENYDYLVALDHLMRCLEVWPQDREILLMAARTARRAERISEAERFQERYVAAHGRTEELVLEWAFLQVQTGEQPELEPSLHEKVRLDAPEASLALEALTMASLKRMRGKQAYQTAQALLKRQPEHPIAWVWRGTALETLNRNEDALEDYRKAVALRPDYGHARMAAAVLLVNFQRFPEAQEQFEWLIERQPEDADVGLGLARCYRNVGQLGLARALLDRLLEKYPQEGLLLSERGQVAQTEGENEAAERWLRQALVLSPYDRQTHYSLYRCLTELGRAEEAAPFLQMHNRLVADFGRLKVVEREMAQGRATAALQGEAGLLCLRVGRFDEGERHLRAALQQDPTLVDIRKALAELSRSPPSSRSGLP